MSLAVLLHVGMSGAEDGGLAASSRPLPVAASERHSARLTPAVRTQDRLRASGITIAGGVSLGSYGAGFLYYYTLVRQQAGEQATLQVITGASVGSINAVLAALSMCRKQELDPQQNLFFDTWIPVGMHGRDGFPGLHDPAAVTKRSLLSRAPLDRVRI